MLPAVALSGALGANDADDENEDEAVAAAPPPVLSASRSFWRFFPSRLLLNRREVVASGEEGPSRTAETEAQSLSSFEWSRPSRE